MPKLQENLNQGLRQLFRAQGRCARKRKRLPSLTSRYHNRLHYRPKRRLCGGQDGVITSSCQSHAVQASRPDGSRNIVPLFHIWQRLNQCKHSLSTYCKNGCARVGRCSLLLQNVCGAVAIYSKSFYRFFISAPKTERDVGGAQPNKDSHGPQPPHILERFFSSISDKVEIALLAEAGPSPNYVFKSPAMNALNLDDIFYDLKSAIIGHVLDNDCNYFLINPTQSLKILSTSNCY